MGPEPEAHLYGRPGAQQLRAAVSSPCRVCMCWGAGYTPWQLAGGPGEMTGVLGPGLEERGEDSGEGQSPTGHRVSR